MMADLNMPPSTFENSQIALKVAHQLKVLAAEIGFYGLDHFLGEATDVDALIVKLPLLGTEKNVHDHAPDALGVLRRFPARFESGCRRVWKNPCSGDRRRRPTRSAPL